MIINVCFVIKYCEMGEVETLASPYQTRVLVLLERTIGKLDVIIQKLIELIECLCGQVPGDDTGGGSHKVKATQTKCKCGQEITQCQESF